MKMIRFIGLLLILAALLLPSLVPVTAQGDQNCALTPERILGQAFTATAGAAFTATAGAAFTATAGAEGEVALEGQTPDGDDIAGDDLSFDADFVMSSLPYVDMGSMSAAQDVALLVVDDFSSSPMDDLEEDEIASHGWLVMNVIDDLLAEVPANIRDRIRVEMLDMADLYYSEDIETLIRGTVDDLNQNEGIQHFVVNMSFVFIPCEDSGSGFDFDRFIDRSNADPSHSLLDDLGASEDYVYNVLTDKRIEKIDEERGRFNVNNNASSNKPGGVPGYQAANVQFLKLLTDNQLASDPLRSYFADMNRSDLTVIPVASAGNFKLTRPLYPARWQEVLSVSATQGEGDDLWTHSNQGEVSAPGAWFTFSDDFERAGTSFAAPVASVLIAVDMTQSAPTCGIRGQGPALGSGRFDNEPITEAADGC